MTTTVYGGGEKMTNSNNENIKRVKVSKQRQISIPKEYHDALNLKEEAFVEYTGKSLIIRPVLEEEVDFSEFILRELMDKGYTGEKLIKEFKETKSKIPNALDAMIEETMCEPVITESLDEYLNLSEIEEEND